LTEFITFSVIQIEKKTETTVSIIANIPIFLKLESACLRYFHAYQSPKGGKNKLTEYTVICLAIVAAGDFSRNCLPQLEQKNDPAGTLDLQLEQIISEGFSIIFFILTKKTSTQKNEG
jgi:hypothetical protein